MLYNVDLFLKKKKIKSNQIKSCLIHENVEFYSSRQSGGPLCHHPWWWLEIFSTLQFDGWWKHQFLKINKKDEDVKIKILGNTHEKYVKSSKLRWFEGGLEKLQILL